MTATGMPDHDWTPPSNADALAPPELRRKRSRLVLGELVGMPVAIAAWTYAVGNFTFYSGHGGQELNAVVGVVDYAAALVLLFWFAVAGVALGLVVIVAQAVLFGFSSRIPRASRWVSSALVLVWVIAAIVLWHQFFVALDAIAEPVAA